MHSMLATAEAIVRSLASVPAHVVADFKRRGYGLIHGGPPGQATPPQPFGLPSGLPMSGPFLETAPDTGPYTTGPAAVWTSIGVEDVSRAILSHDMGEFWLSAQMWDAIRTDPRIFTTVDTRVLGVLGLPFAVKTAKMDSKGDAKLAQKYADEIRSWWGRPFPAETLAEFDRWKIGIGLSVGEQWWYFDEEEQDVRIAGVRVHHPMFLMHRWFPQQGYWLTTTSGVHPVTPGDGRWLMITQGGDRPWMQGVIRTLGRTFIRRQQGLRDFARRSECEGAGIRDVGVPAGTRKEVADKVVAAVARLGDTTTLKRPPGFEFKIHSIDPAAAGAFMSLVGQSDSDITLPILGQNLTTEIEKGSMAAATVHQRVQLDRITADVQGFASLREQSVVPWGRYNKAGWKDRYAPTPWYDPTPPEDIRVRALALQALGASLDKLEAHGFDVRELGEYFHLRLRDVSEDEAKKITGTLSEYHFKFGILTVNEIRASLGLPPVDGGDARPVELSAQQDPPVEIPIEGEPQEEPEEPVQAPTAPPFPPVAPAPAEESTPSEKP